MLASTLDKVGSKCPRCIKGKVIFDWKENCPVCLNCGERFYPTSLSFIRGKGQHHNRIRNEYKKRGIPY